MKIIFLGTPEFGAIILEELIRGGYKPDLVITETDKPVGRKGIITPPLVKTLALRYNIPVAQPEKIINYNSELRALKPDLAIVAAYGQIIPKEILDIPKYGFLNVHPSLLPKYRGPTPIQSPILYGDEKTGVSIILLDEKMDHGPILISEEIGVSNEIKYEELHNKLAGLGAQLLLKIIPDWISGKIKPMKQEEKESSYTKILKRENGRIDWKRPAEDIERQIRAFDPWPGSFTEYHEGESKIIRIKIWKTKVKEQTKHGPFGIVGKTFMASNEQIAVQTGKHFLVIEELQPEGGKRITAKEFLTGRSDFIGTILK